MERMSDHKIVLVKRKTRLEELIIRYNTVEQARFYIEHLGSDFSDYLNEDRRYREEVTKAQRILEALGRVQVVDREFVPNFIFGDRDVVVAIGQDGLVANTLKYLTGQPLLGVNPDPARWDGVLLPFKTSDLHHVLPEVFLKKRTVREVAMAKAVLNDGQVLYAVNDLFIGQKTHVSSRYRIQISGRQEDQSSSGVIVSTGLGSTGWLKSVITGASRIAGLVSGREESTVAYRNLAWNNDSLYYSVREPFPTRTSGTELVFGEIPGNDVFRICSFMPENGVIFSDGVESDFLQFNAGVEASISVAEKRGYLVQ